MAADEDQSTPATADETEKFDRLWNAAAELVRLFEQSALQEDPELLARARAVIAAGGAFALLVQFTPVPRTVLRVVSADGSLAIQLGILQPSADGELRMRFH